MTIVICLILAIIVAAIYTSILKGQLKTIHSQEGADNYKKSGSFKVTESNDRFLYRRVEKTKRETKKD